MRINDCVLGEEQTTATASQEPTATAAAASVEPLSIDEQIAAEPLLPGYYHPRFEDLELLDDLLEPEASEDLSQSQNAPSSREGSIEL